MKTSLAMLVLGASIALVSVARSEPAPTDTTVARDAALDRLPGGLQATSAGGGLAFERQSLDTQLVLTIVREHLEEAATKAAASALRRLGLDAERPWARDLLTTVARFAVTPADTRGVQVEEALRIGARMMVAQVVVNSRPLDWKTLPAPGTDEARRRHLADWIYWRLSKVKPLDGDAAVPACKHAGSVKDLCAALAALDEAKRIVELDRIVGAGRIFEILAAVERLAADKDAPIDPAILVEALLRFDDGAIDELRAANKDLDQALATATGASASLFAWWEAVRSKTKELHKELREGRAIGIASSQAVTAMHAFVNAAFLDVDAAEYGAANTAITTLITGMRGTFLAPATSDFLDRLERILTYAWAWRAKSTDRAALYAVITDQMLTDLDGASDLTVDAKKLAALPADLAAIATDLKSLYLHARDASQLERLAADITRAATHADELGAALARLGGAPVPQLDRASVALHRLGAVASAAARLVRVLGKGTFDDAVAAASSLGSITGMAFDGTILERLAPIARLLRASKGAKASQVYALIAAQDPRQLLADVGIDLGRCDDKDAKDRPRPWECWAGRMIVALHGALDVDGDKAKLDASAIAAELSRFGAGERQRQTWRPYLHLAVGAGILWDPVLGGPGDRTRR